MMQVTSLRDLLVNKAPNSTLQFSQFQTPVLPIDISQLKKLSSQLGGAIQDSGNINSGDTFVTITRDQKEVLTVVFPVTNPLSNPKEFINRAINSCGVRGKEITVGLYNQKA